MFHEFEEIFLFTSWVRNHEKTLVARVPRLKSNILCLQTPAFVLAVLEEFVLVSICIIFSLLTGNSAFWYFCLLAFTIHLAAHIVHFIILRCFVPSVVTSILCLPYCVYALCAVWVEFLFATNVILTFTSVVFCVGNLLLMHKVCMSLWLRIERSINKGWQRTTIINSL